MKLGQFFLPFLLLARVTPAAADVLTDFFPPETRAVIGIRVHSLAVSGLVQALKSQLQAQAPSINWLKMVPLNGFVPLRDIDEVMLAIGAGGPNPPALIVVAGKFDVARLSKGATPYHGVPLIGGSKDTDSVIALVDGSTAIAGDPKMVRAAIDRREGSAHIDSSLNDRITSLRQRYDVWGLGERLEGFTAPTPEAKSLESIDRFQFGIQLTAGLELAAEIHARTSQDAEKLSSMLQMIAAMAKAQQPSTSGAKFDFEADGGTMKLTVSIPEAELKKMLQTQKAGLAPASPTVAAVPALPSPGVTPPAVPEVPAAPAKAPARPAAKAPAAQVVDTQGNTIVLQLPGKK